MSDVYKQLQEKFILPNAREDWSEYRTSLTKLVNAQAGEHVLVIGAGRCNDIELSDLHFDRITLMDVDEAAMREAVEELSPEFRDRVSVRCASVTGIEEADVMAFCDRVLNRVRSLGTGFTAARLAGCMHEELDRLEDRLSGLANRLETLLPVDTYDVIVMNGVCSQLFSMLLFFIRSVVASVSDAIVRETSSGSDAVFPEQVNVAEIAEKRLSEMNVSVIPIVNRAIIRATRKTAIFGNEDPEDGHVEGAYHCISDVRENYSPEEQTLFWTFHKARNVIYRMTIQIVDKGGVIWKEER